MYGRTKMGESSRYWSPCCHFTEGAERPTYNSICVYAKELRFHLRIRDAANEDVRNQCSQRTGRAQRKSRANEQACSNGPSNLRGVRAQALSKEPITAKHDLLQS